MSSHMTVVKIAMEAMNCIGKLPCVTVLALRDCPRDARVTTICRCSVVNCHELGIRRGVALKALHGFACGFR